MSMKEYLETLETKFIDVAAKDDPLEELECVENFIKIICYLPQTSHDIFL